MGPFSALDHLLNFALPAAFVALVLTVAGRFLLGRARGGPSGWRLGLLLFAVGLAVLVAGVWLLGRDGKMATYAALVVTTAFVQWLFAGGWRR